MEATWAPEACKMNSGWVFLVSNAFKTDTLFVDVEFFVGVGVFDFFWLLSVTSLLRGHGFESWQMPKALISKGNILF